MIATITLLGYLVATGFWLWGLKRGRSSLRCVAACIGLCAWLAHLGLLYQWIDLATAHATILPAGQNLYISNVFSLVVWCAILIVQLLALKRRDLYNLAVLLYPMAAVSIFLILQFPGYYILPTAENTGQLLHVLVAVATFSILGVAAILALFMGIQDSLLRRNQLSRILRVFPPLETMERFLYVLVAIGFSGLTLVLTGSIVANYLTSKTVETHSPYLALLAWVAFLILLLGRRFRAWRGKTLVAWTMVGVVTLSLSYFGTWVLHGMINPASKVGIGT